MHRRRNVSLFPMGHRILMDFLLTVRFVVLSTLVYILGIAKYASVPRESRDSFMPTCTAAKQSLLGSFDTQVSYTSPNESKLLALSNELSISPGGSWSSPDCPSSPKLAIIIPYRDRWVHLTNLLTNLHPYLQRQQANYRIFIVEQAYNETFNKGLIMNIAFKEVMQLGKWDCVIFHDVDMIPQNDYNIYQCGKHPNHLSSALDNMRFTLMYPNLVGGVLALTPEHMMTVNGYSNLYWGWGAEDDDMSLRILNCGYEIHRPASYIGRYKMMIHSKRAAARNRVQLLQEWQRFRNDGVNSLASFPIRIIKRTMHHLYTNITVDIGQKPANLPIIKDSHSNGLKSKIKSWLFLLQTNI